MRSFLKMTRHLLGVVFSGFLLTPVHADLRPLTIGIIIPMEHQALRDLVGGYQETLTHAYSAPITFIVENAQGDMNLQKALIQQLHQRKVDLVVPVGTSVTQMTAKEIHDIPIISLAALYSEEERKAQVGENLSGVVDELPLDLPLKFILEAYPGTKKIALVHSATDKPSKEAREIAEHAKAYGVEVYPVMIHTMADLYTIAPSIPQDCQGILVTKDHPVVSGITVLAKLARKTGRFLMTMDEGSVKAGAQFALGVKEADIGKLGAELTLKFLKGTPLKDLPLQALTQGEVYINKAALPDPEAVVKAAQKMGYRVVMGEGHAG